MRTHKTAQKLVTSGRQCMHQPYAKEMSSYAVHGMCADMLWGLNPEVPPVHLPQAVHTPALHTIPALMLFTYHPSHSILLCITSGGCPSANHRLLSQQIRHCCSEKTGSPIDLSGTLYRYLTLITVHDISCQIGNCQLACRAFSATAAARCPGVMCRLI